MQQRNFTFSKTTFALVCITGMLHADSTSDIQPDQPSKLERRVAALEQEQGFNLNGGKEVDGFGLFFTADYLLWQAYENGLEFVFKNDNSNTEFPLSDSDAKNLDFKYQSGFRFGLGYNLSHDGWDFYLNWTRLHGRAHGHEKASSSGFLVPTLGAGSSGLERCEEASSKWKLHLNVLDLEMGREFKTSKWLNLRPHIGFRSAWIRQKWDTDYKVDVFTENLPAPGLSNYEIEMKQHFWGFGLRAGLDSQWGFGSGWSIYGNSAISVLMGFFHNKHEEDFTPILGSETIAIDTKNSMKTGKATIDLQIGIRWDHMFADEKYHLGLQAGWEYHLFFSQNQFMHFVDDISRGVFVGNQGDLSLQGLTLSARLDF